MTVAALWLTWITLFAGQFGQTDGVIEGVVLNQTDDPVAAAGTEVVLRVLIDGQFVSVESTTTGSDGTFRFVGLPTGDDIRYLPGANYGDVHFPGPRVALTSSEPAARVQLHVFEPVSEPSPLVIEEFDIALRAAPGLLTVTETLVINNPSKTCFVGRPRHEGGGPVTMQLAIPSDFERITFDKEAFGRRFAVINERLVTGIPWPPGRRELRYTYVIANEQTHRSWLRPLDLPCARVSLTAISESPADVSCTLGRLPAGPDNELRFASDGPLPAGHVVRLELGQLPVSKLAYARYVALITLVGLVAAVSVASLRQSKLRRLRVARDRAPRVAP